MADQKNAAGSVDHERLEEVALSIFSVSLATGVHPTQMQQAAQRAFEGAETFLNLSREIENGRPVKAKPKGGRKFADCFAPNLPKNHPLNIVAERHKYKDGTYVGGDAKLIDKIYDRIKGIDLNKMAPDYVLDDPELSILWDRPVIQTAQQIFPHYAEQLANSSSN